MKTIALLILLVCSNAYAGDPYSHGFRMGQLTKFSVKGFFSKSGEGELMMGNESTPWYTRSGDSKTQKNPWAFSAKPDLYKALQNNSGEYVYLEYDQSALANPLERDTDYYVTDVRSVQPESAPQGSCVDKNAEGDYSKGYRVGRIVKASYKGLFNKSYEVIVQVGNSGGNFMEMTLVSEAMFNCAIEWLKSGKKVRVDYLQRTFVLGVSRDTDYDVYKLSKAASLD